MAARTRMTTIAAETPMTCPMVAQAERLTTGKDSASNCRTAAGSRGCNNRAYSTRDAANTTASHTGHTSTRCNGTEMRANPSSTTWTPITPRRAPGEPRPRLRAAKTKATPTVVMTTPRATPNPAGTPPLCETGKSTNMARRSGIPVSRKKTPSANTTALARQAQPERGRSARMGAAVGGASGGGGGSDGTEFPRLIRLSRLGRRTHRTQAQSH